MKVKAEMRRALLWIDEHGVDAPRPAVVTDALTAVAEIAHEANRAYCLFLGDNSQPAWDSAPDWQKASAIEGIAFHFRNPAAGPDAAHNAWMDHKIAAGWIHGETKDPDATPPTHPNLVPFNDLPPAAQFKDALFASIANAAAARAREEGAPPEDGEGQAEAEGAA